MHVLRPRIIKLSSFKCLVSCSEAGRLPLEPLLEGHGAESGRQRHDAHRSLLAQELTSDFEELWIIHAYRYDILYI